MLYKYVKKNHMESFFGRGLIKIGTLYEYRNEEKLGTVVGDETEGVLTTELNAPEGREIGMADNSAESKFIRNAVTFNHPQPSKISLVMEAGASIRFRTESQNYYIYCITSCYDETVMKEFECEKCIEIFDSEKFFKAISRVIQHKGTFDGLYEISYGNKTTNHLNPHKIHPALLKEQKYANQAEVRAIWIPKKEPESPLFINVPKAVKYCREYRP